MHVSEGSADRTPVVVAVRRTAFGKVTGIHRSLRADELLAPVLKELAVGVVPDDVIIGNAIGAGGNLARLAALRAGLGNEVPGVTVDRQCGSGLEAIIQTCRLIQAGAGSAYLAGGVESISTAPGRANRMADGSWEFFTRARFSPEELGDPDMGVGAENVATHFQIARERQDAFTERSHLRTLASQAAGKFTDEIIGDYQDECPRRGLKASLLARFPAVFVPGGTVTAGNSCQDADGAAAVLMVSKQRAIELGFNAGLEFLSAAAAGVDPNLPGIGAAAAIQALGGVQHAARVEITEAFAAQALACADLMGVAEQDINLDGGALALGHPYGASGVLQVIRIFKQLQKLRAGTEGLAAMSIAGGMGLASRWRWQEF
ncbi:thiolase family protein [Renibacterium salmoninarum]